MGKLLFWLLVFRPVTTDPNYGTIVSLFAAHLENGRSPSQDTMQKGPAPKGARLPIGDDAIKEI
jgi:hypothetical protein